MGNAIWIFLGIAVLQAIVGGIAKSAEKRKKAEAAKRMLEARESGGETPNGGVAAAASLDTRAKSNNSAQRRLQEAREKKRQAAQSRLDALRKRRLEVLRRRSGPDGGVTAAIDPNQARARSAAATPPPPVAAPPAEVNRQQPVRNQPAPARSKASPRVSAKSVPAARPATSRTGTINSKAETGRKPRPGGPAAGRRSSSSSRKAGAKGSTASGLRRRLRSPKGFREALLLGELLKPPVGLRPPGDEVG